MKSFAPLDAPTLSTTSILECPKLRWGILGCGRVSHDFCTALSLIPTAEIAACATSSSLERAQAFASNMLNNNTCKAYGSYEELVKDESVDIIYVGNVHSFRRRDGEMCLNAGKHVLLEKPLACTVEDAKYLIDLAREKKLFLMEGMWTRFFPAFELARQLIRDGIIGQVVNVASDFNFNAADSEAYPDSFVYQRKLGGGASLLTGPYPIAAALAMFDSRTPKKIRVVGQVDDTTGVDLQATIALEFAPSPDAYNDPDSPQPAGAGVASLSYGLVGESKEVTTVVGTKGRITIESPGHCPISLLVEQKAAGRGKASTERYEFPLPQQQGNVSYHYPNSAGFCYEAAAVARCIQQGCCPQFTQDETLICQEILEAVRQQLCLKTVHEE